MRVILVARILLFGLVDFLGNHYVSSALTQYGGLRRLRHGSKKYDIGTVGKTP